MSDWNPNNTGIYTPRGVNGGQQQPIMIQQNPNQYQIPSQQQYNNVPSYNNNGMQNYNQLFLKCRPVSSREEARAAQIDLDGSLWVFTDIGNEKIYTKRINNDGTASFNTYARIEEKENPPSYMMNSGDYITRDEFNNVIQALMAAMQPQQGAQPSPQQNEEAIIQHDNNNKPSSQMTF